MKTNSTYIQVLCAALPSLFVCSTVFATQRKASTLSVPKEESGCNIQFRTQPVPISEASSKLISPDGKWAIHIGENMAISSTEKNSKKQKTLGNYYSFSTSFSPQISDDAKKLLAAGKYDGTVSIFDLSKNDITDLLSLKACNSEVFATALSDHSRLLVQCGTKEIVAYDISNPKSPARLEIKHSNQPSDFISSIAISPSGRYIALGDKSGELRSYEWGDGHFKETQKVLNFNSTSSHLVFSPDESVLIEVPSQSFQMITAHEITKLSSSKNLYPRPKTYAYTLDFSGNELIGRGIGSASQGGISTFKQTVGYDQISGCFHR